MKRFALAGNPNCGKTTLFNSLTGSTAHVGNWPGVTVEKKDGVYKKLGEPISIIDLPGIYSLSPYTPEEVISRNYILDEHPDCVINIVDATNLERNLYLTTQLLEIDVPLVVALNMTDILAKHGDRIDVAKIEQELGVPVISISALKEDNLDDLMKRALEVSQNPRQGHTIISNKGLLHLIGDVRIGFEGKKVENPLFHAIKLVENDELETANHPDLLPMVEAFKENFQDETFGDDFEAIIADSRYHYIADYLHDAVIKKEPDVVEDGMVKSFKRSKSDKIDKVLTHKVFGLLIFAVILFFIFHLTFSEDLLYLGAMGVNFSNNFEGTIYEGLFWTESGINSPGVMLFNFFDMSFAAITDAAHNGLDSALGAGHWFTGFLCDGVLSGLFAILGFLPQILVLFLFFSIMEDSGYMARVAFILDRIFRRFGLTGRAFIPMIMGFGCSVPAMINTRTLAEEKEKISTIRVIPFFCCGAKLPILVAIAGGILEAFGAGNVDAISFGMYAVGVAAAIACLFIMKHTTQRGGPAPFIMELPEYHWPQFKGLMIHLWDKAKHFVKKAFTIILASTIIIWFLSNFGWNWHYLDGDISGSILSSIGAFIQPLFTPLGFGSQLTSIGFVFAVATITGLVAKENVVATFAAFAAIIVTDPAIAELIAADEEGVEAATAVIIGSGITWQGCIAFIAFNMLTVPCFASCATAKAELRKGTFKWTLLFWLVTSYVGASLVYVFLSMFDVRSYMWACPAFAGALVLAAVAIMGIVIYNKKHPYKEA